MGVHREGSFLGVAQPEVNTSRLPHYNTKASSRRLTCNVRSTRRTGSSCGIMQKAPNCGWFAPQPLPSQP